MYTCLLCCVYLSPPGSSPLIPHLLFKVRIGLRKAVFWLAVLHVPQKPSRRWVFYPLKQELFGCSRNWMDAFEKDVIYSCMKSQDNFSASSEGTPLMLQNYSTWNFILGFKTSLWCLGCNEHLVLCQRGSSRKLNSEFLHQDRLTHHSLASMWEEEIKWLSCHGGQTGFKHMLWELCPLHQPLWL